MAYQINDAKGYLSFGPSIEGWRQVKAFIAAQGDWPHPALSQIIEHGYTNLLPALSTECRYLASKATNQDIKDSLSHLGTLALQADEIVALGY